jgi:hypothetical protein
VVVRVLLRAGADSEAAREFLEQAGVPYELLSAGEGVDWARLREFAEEEGADLVGELCAGYTRLLATAFHSLAQAVRRDSDKPLYLGEAWETRNGTFIRSARLRLLGNGFWKREGWIYPGMLYFSPRSMQRWAATGELAMERSAEWRWELIRQGHRSGRLCQVRRTLATCEVSCVSVLDRYHALRAGAERIYAGNGEPQRGSWLLRIKPVLKTASYVLPGSWRAKGKRIWEHLVGV